MKVVTPRGLSLATCLGYVLLAPVISRAQDTPPPPAPQEDAPARDAATPAPQAAPFDGAAKNFRDRPGPPGGPGPEDQRQDNRRQEKLNMENRLRGLMAAVGIQETGTQDALITYLSEDEKAKNEVREASRRLMVALRREATPDRMKDLISAYKNSLENEKIRRRAAQASLDAKVGYSTNPRLEAMLWVVGVLGDGNTGVPMYQAINRGPNMANNGQKPNNTINARVTANIVVDGNQVSEFITGTIETKTNEFLELRDEAGHIERYFPRPNPAPALVAPGLEKVDLDSYQQLAVGQRVRIEWTQQDVRRIVAVRPAPAPLQAAVPPLQAPEAP